METLVPNTDDAAIQKALALLQQRPDLVHRILSMGADEPHALDQDSGGGPATTGSAHPTAAPSRQELPPLTAGYASPGLSKPSPTHCESGHLGQRTPSAARQRQWRPSVNAVWAMLKLLHLVLTGSDAHAGNHMNFYNTLTVLVPFPDLPGSPLEEVPVSFVATRAGHFMAEYFRACGLYIARMPHLYSNKCSESKIPETCERAAGGKVVYQTELAYAKQDTLLNLPLVFAMAMAVSFRYFCRDYGGFIHGMAEFDGSCDASDTAGRKNCVICKALNSSWLATQTARSEMNC